MKLTKTAYRGLIGKWSFLSTPIKPHQHPCRSSSSPFPAAASQLLLGLREERFPSKEPFLPFSHQRFCGIVGDSSRGASVNVFFLNAERAEVSLVITVLKITVITSLASLSAWILLCDVTYEDLYRERGGVGGCVRSLICHYGCMTVNYNTTFSLKLYIIWGMLIFFFFFWACKWRVT